MTISSFVQIGIAILAAICFRWAWKVPTPGGGDAGLGDAIAKVIGYGATTVLVFILVMWLAIQHIQWR